MTREELNKVLVNHKHWLEEDCEGWEEMKADLSCAELSYSNLSYLNLHDADFSHADLRFADLSGANLSGADLSGADLSGAKLHGADLSCADLSGAKLHNADLNDADLRDADLRDAGLHDADFRGADLRYSNLRGACFRGSDLRFAKNVPFIPYACPDFGRFIGYKKASGYIVELEIPEDAKRLSATTRKCRCNKAKVLRILNYDRTVANVTSVKSNYDNTFIYRVGKIVSVDNFNEDRWNECSTGIHFFINFQEAVEY